MDTCHSCGGTHWDLPTAGCVNRLFHRTPPRARHWVTRFDPDDGQPYGELCECEIDQDHDGLGNLT